MTAPTPGYDICDKYAAREAEQARWMRIKTILACVGLLFGSIALQALFGEHIWEYLP